MEGVGEALESFAQCINKWIVSGGKPKCANGPPFPHLIAYASAVCLPLPASKSNLFSGARCWKKKKPIHKKKHTKIERNRDSSWWWAFDHIVCKYRCILKHWQERWGWNFPRWTFRCCTMILKERELVEKTQKRRKQDWDNVARRKEKTQKKEKMIDYVARRKIHKKKDCEEEGERNWKKKRKKDLITLPVQQSACAQCRCDRCQPHSEEVCAHHRRFCWRCIKVRTNSKKKKEHRPIPNRHKTKEFEGGGEILNLKTIKTHSRLGK